MASTDASCSFGTTRRPLASPRTTSPGRTVTPPHCTTTLIAPGPWFDPVAGWAPTANVGAGPPQALVGIAGPAAPAQPAEQRAPGAVGAPGRVGQQVGGSGRVVPGQNLGQA